DLAGVVARQAARDRTNLDPGIERAHPGFGAFGLVAADVVGPVDRLALQVARVDRVVVDQYQRPDPGAREVLQRRRADPPDADEDDRRARQRGLAGPADLGQHDVAGEAGEAVGRKGHARAYDIP